MLALFVIAGMLTFCVFAIAIFGGGDAHSIQFNQATYGIHESAFLHGGDMTLLAIPKTISFVADFILAVFFTVLVSLYDRNTSLNGVFINYVRQKFYDIVYYVQKIAHDWLALFELSPSFV